jgi:hemolysin D
MKLKKWCEGWQALTKLWRERDKLADRKLSEDLKSFLPPALEVMEKPPHPAAWWLLRIITAIVVVALIWSIFGKVNVVSVAEGKIIPVGKIKEIQPYDHGMIRAILVTEGQIVEAGQPLIELDRTQTEADERRLLSERGVVEPKRRRRLALMELLRRTPGEPVSDEMVVFHEALEGDRDNGRKLLEEYRAIVFQRQALESQIIERRAELASSQVLMKQYAENTPLAKQRLEAYEKLYLKGQVGLTDYMSAKVYYNEQVYGLEAEEHRSEQLTAAINSAERQLAAQVAQSLTETMEELDELTRQLEAIDQELIKVQDLTFKQVLYAPIRGAVKGLLTNTVGGVVTPAQVLMEIVPLGEKLEVEAFLGNQDIGYVKNGQAAEIKVATYPFTKYGVINATVEHVAEDATVDEKLGLIYRIQLAMEKGTIMVNGKKEPLMPGMAVSAEIATDERRIIEFVLAPLLRMKDESLRER